VFEVAGMGYKLDARQLPPSKDSIIKAIRRYKFLDNERKKRIHITYIRGVGNKSWNDGEAALDDKSRESMIKYFGKKKVKADKIDLFWTIHYMMDTKTDMLALMNNIDVHSKKETYITILCMDGDRILELLQKNDGVYSVMDGDDVIFRLTAKFDYRNKEMIGEYGNTVNVILYGAYGLGGGIDENIVFKDTIIKRFTEKNFKLKEFHRFLDVGVPEREELREYEKKVSDLYVVYGFEKWE